MQEGQYFSKFEQEYTARYIAIITLPPNAFGGVVVTIFALHAEGPGFDSSLAHNRKNVYFLFKFVEIVLLDPY